MSVKRSSEIETIVQNLQAVGLSLYEARVYLALLQHGAQNGNELSKSSGVPSSKVYSTVEKLIGLGIVHSIHQGSTTKFVPIEPDELVARLRARYNEPIDFLTDALPTLAAARPTDEAFLTVSGLDSVREAARAILDSAHGAANLSLWREDADYLRDSLAAAVERGVRVFGMLYGDDAEMPPGRWLHHSYEEIVGNRIGGRMLTLVADSAEALIARIPVLADATGVRTRSPVLTLIVQEYLHHDLVLQRAQINIGFDEWDRWWQADPDLRATILGTTLELRGNGGAS
jgi:HTH-type transcriptional regulator, sugar sensing transcriptional regulator